MNRPSIHTASLTGHVLIAHKLFYVSQHRSDVRSQELLGQIIFTPLNKVQNLLVLLAGLIRDTGEVGAHKLIAGQTGGNGVIEVNDPMITGRFDQFCMKVGERVMCHVFLSLIIRRRPKI